jgi:hypothetical protein
MADRRNGAQSPEEQVRALFEEAESTTAKAFEELVRKPSFGRLLALSAENTAALTRIAFDTIDLMWRNLRVAGRADIVRLSRQLHRNEDKLERVLQEVESLRDLVARDREGEEAESLRDFVASDREGEEAESLRDFVDSDREGEEARS